MVSETFEMSRDNKMLVLSFTPLSINQSYESTIMINFKPFEINSRGGGMYSPTVKFFYRDTMRQHPPTTTKQSLIVAIVRGLEGGGCRVVMQGHL
jgi:hypothetical protein